MSSAIIEKIKALLRLGRSGNRHEAELAMRKAFELTQKHHVDVTGLDIDEETEHIGHEAFSFGRRVSYLQGRVLNVLVNFFHVDVCIRWESLVFVGTPTDIAIAHYVYGFLCQQGQSLLRRWCSEEKKLRRRMSADKKKNFIQGFIYGIVEQLRQQKEVMQVDDSKTAIILAERQNREKYMDDLVPGNTPKKLKAPEKRRGALMSGYFAGQDTKINKPLTGSGKEVLALTA